MKKLNIVLTIILIFFVTSLSVFAQNIKYDKKIGEKKYNEIVKTNGIYVDVNMTNYINRVGQRLVSNLDSALFKYKFFIVDDYIPNAFALPGGYIFITKGLISILNTEAELAGVMAHEIIHANNRHGIRQIKKRIIPVILTLPINIIGIVPCTGIITKPIMGAENLLFASYSRKFETEADEQGVTLASRSGYDPLALKRALDRLMNVFEYLTGEKEQRNYLIDHPYTPTREKSITEIAKKLRTVKIKPITNNFITEFKGLGYGKSTKKWIVKENIFIQASKDIYVEFPEFWRFSNFDTLIVAQSPHKDAVFSLSIVDSVVSVKEIGEQYLKKLSNKHKKVIVKSGACMVNDTEAFEVKFEEISFNDTIFGRTIWLPIGGNLVNINTISDIKKNNTINDIIGSLRTLSNKEKESIMVQYLDIVRAKEKESVPELCKRTQNMIKPSLTSIINDIDINKSLKKDQEIKVVKERVYIPK